MKILRILGIVAAVHVVAVVLLFSIQGCSSDNKSTPSSPAATTDNAPATVQFNSSANASPVTPVTGADLNPATSADPAPGISFNGSSTLYSPTRPGTPAATAIASSAPVTNVTPAATYSVVKGDNFSKIAGKYHLTSAELAKANNLKLSSPLKVGQKLIIPGKAVPAAAGGSTYSSADTASGTTTYKVKAGDSLRLIAKHNGTTVAELKSLNHLKSDGVRVGQELKLPTGVGPAPAAAAVVDTSSAPVSVDAAPEPAKNAGGQITHTVKPGEKLGTIAKKYGVTVGELATANNISDPGKIRAGQELVIPNGSAPAGKSAKPGALTEPAPPSPPAGGDLDSGLKPTSEEPPVIKVDDTPPAPAPDASSATDNSGAPKNP
ncbi:MAG TPA: LysM peptidoglycan-binding domain-containing protein [Opitutaceae bacterium]|jgi:LysM repeat protein|nr:LysM peptidoglycan-binding domain-containing protein [Opitutaceae bacterium]